MFKWNHLAVWLHACKHRSSSDCWKNRSQLIRESNKHFVTLYQKKKTIQHNHTLRTAKSFVD